MTGKQFKELLVGSEVMRTDGPNKGIPLIVVSKYHGSKGNYCLAAIPKNENDVLYVQHPSMRGSNRICGSARTFSIIKRKDN